ncbi:MAG: ParB N-terminal domain-containing protein, partial [Candidatus Peribacteraceae bacterium]|nr:ParB N-terminal domain-containing protein [Candidatus Peribacteraceae bacterium]
MSDEMQFVKIGDILPIYNYPRTRSVIDAINNKVEQYFFPENESSVDPKNLFVFDDGNRSIKKSDVRNLIEMISKTGVITSIVVDENGYIIDGQHRAVAAAKLGYMVQISTYNLTEKTPDLIQALNISQKNWSNVDWKALFLRKGVLMESYIEDVKQRIGGGCGTDTVLSVYMGNPWRYSQFKKLSVEEMNIHYSENR